MCTKHAQKTERKSSNKMKFRSKKEQNKHRKQRERRNKNMIFSDKVEQKGGPAPVRAECTEKV